MHCPGLVLLLNLVVLSSAEESWSGTTGTHSRYSGGESKEWMPSDEEPLRLLVESLLERMERQEKKLQRMEKTIQENTEDLKRKDIRVNNLERELDEMKTLYRAQVTEDKHRQYDVPKQDNKSDLPQEKHNSTDDITTSQKPQDKVMRPVRVPSEEAVGAFSVSLSRSMDLHANFVLTYDEVNLDKGGNYNKVDGVYTAPISGVYVFTWTSTGTTTDDVFTELVVDGSSRGTILADGDQYHWDSATGLIVTPVAAGDHVFIRSKRGGHLYSEDYYGKVTFSGWRLS
ncbi:uncharacterized protein LOC117342779 [Pecten maximus]|uniref:uncharacterized protein LOC117342779 n=1 Tax=Pecten maximus TaxID=6579 RepID=UPI001458D9CA|nr:uncharacterized protein LOC117342779 [Pecten maximus]